VVDQVVMLFIEAVTHNVDNCMQARFVGHANSGLITANSGLITGIVLTHDDPTSETWEATA
jgi:hypothetical protein